VSFADGGWMMVVGERDLSSSARKGMDGRSDSIREGIDDQLHSDSQLVFLVRPVDIQVDR